MYIRFSRFLFVLCFSTIRFAAAAVPGSVENVVHLADSLKASLSASQISTLQLSYSYTNAQTWSNLPTSMQPRLGIRLGALSTAQLAIAKKLIGDISGTTLNEGYDEANQLFLADAYLAANGGGSSYGEGLYYLCFNGTPSLTGLFSVKVGGHHLQIEHTYNNGVMVGATPHFEAVEPLTFTWSGSTYSPITQEKTALANMFSTLSTSELNSAKLSTTYSDILMGAKNNGSYKDWIFPATKVGLKVGNLTAAQKQRVYEAIKTYVLDTDDAHADAILTQYLSELDETYISYSGNSSLNSQNDYARIDGPGVWIEFTVQPGIVLSGVHYHSIWRDHTRDYGGAGSSAGVQSTAIGASGSNAIGEPASLIESFICYPNPSSDYINVSLVLAGSAQVSLELTDASGRVIRQILNNELMQASEQQILCNLSELPGGLYYLCLIVDNRRKTVAIVKS